MRTLNFRTSQEAWEGLNEMFILEAGDILETGGLKTGSQLIAYDTFINIKKAWVNPEFDFHRFFNYHLQKWRSLVNNYVDMTYLDLVRSDVYSREKKNSRNYNVAYQFSNTHSSGKNCLLALTFSRRSQDLVPRITAFLRSSEIVKRLIFDLLLIQRMGEYVYGEKSDFSLHLVLPSAYTQTETSSVYFLHKPSLLDHKPDKKSLEYFNMVKQSFHHLSEIDPEKVSYKIHLRSVRVLQRDQASYTKTLLAKNLSFNF